MENTKISWADHTFNPWIGCMKVTDGCKNCYAERMDIRYQGGAHWGPNSKRQITTPQNWNKVKKWDKAAREEGTRKVVFVASLADVWEDNPQLIIPRQRLYELAESCTNLDFLFLTKRPENIITMAPRAWHEKWPVNIMPGTSICTHKDVGMISAISHAAGRLKFKYFLSMEPLLTAISLLPSYELESQNKPHSIIVGGESGPGARIMHADWVRRIKAQCEKLGIVFHFKQWGEWCPECEDLPHLGAKQLWMWKDGRTIVVGGESAAPQPMEEAEKMIRYGVKTTGNRLDGEYHMPRIFSQYL